MTTAKRITRILLCTLAAVGSAGCNSVELNDTRVPRAAVYVPFTTAADWDHFGVGGALESRRFIRSERVPSDFAYPDYSYTGYGGVLLTMDVNSEPLAFDLACPIERDPTVRVVIDRESNMAKCQQCGSSFDVFSINGEGPGAPADGPARLDGYALRSYRVVFGADGRYALITN